MNTLERAKYRAKRIDNGEWAYGSLVKIESGEVFIFSRYFIPANSIPSEWMIPIDKETVGQFTGLKEAFEGDIIDDGNGHYSVIKWSDHQGGFYASTEHEDFPLDGGEWWEVCGNIHDNPELLEVAK